MSSKYSEAFDSLKSDDYTKHRRTERVLYAQHEGADQVINQGGAASAAKARGNAFSGKRGVALITALAIFFAVVVSIPLGIILYNGRGLLGAMSRLKNTFVDMEGVAAFGVWNAPEPVSAYANVKNVSSANISHISYINAVSDDADESGNEQTGETGGNGGISTGDWSDDERYDWESDYDWDPTKANVLIAIEEDGGISEVVYERTNGRGQVRQDVLGNAAMVYVSNGFTYVMYVDDDEWEFWKEINFVQEMRSPSGFHCHHESMQTIVIHNATGKVFALKDLIPQVNELSGATNYTMQVHPFKDDFLLVHPMYGNRIPQWYNVIYDEQEENLRYELMLPSDCEALNSYYWDYYVRAARRDIYGQQYLLEGYNATDEPRITAGIVNLPSYKIYGKSLVFNVQNGLMSGADGRMYAFDNGKLKVFGENFELKTVEAGTEVTFEGVAHEFFDWGRGANEGIVYRLSGGYLYSMFGEVWKVDDDGTMHEREKLEGSFPRYADNGYMLGGEIIAFVDTEQTYNGYYSINGRMVQICFDSADGAPRAEIKHIIDASELSVSVNNRIVVWQCERPYSQTRGEVKYFLITVENGKPYADYFGYGSDGGIYGLTRPITEPLMLS